MRRFTTRLIFAVLAAILIVGMAGCAPAKSSGPATVKVLAMEQAGPTVDEMNSIVAEFNKTNPNTKVVIEYVSYDALHDKIATAMAANPPSYDLKRHSSSVVTSDKAPAARARAKLTSIASVAVGRDCSGQQ